MVEEAALYLEMYSKVAAALYFPRYLNSGCPETIDEGKMISVDTSRETLSNVS